MRKILYIVGLATMILFNATAVSASNDIYYINENEIAMTEEEYNNLINLGFTERQISWMDEDVFLENKDIVATSVAHQKYIVKTTTVIRNGITRSYNRLLTEKELKEEMELRQQPSGTNFYGNFYDGMTFDSIKEIDMRIAIYDDEYARYKLDTYWDVIPTHRYFDVAGIYFDGTLTHRYSSVIHRQYYVTTGNDHVSLEDYYYDSNSNSAYIAFELPSGSLESLESYMYFTARKNVNVGTITELYVYGDYAHAAYQTTQAVINNVSMYAGGLWFSIDYDFLYDDIPTANAYFVGSW